MWMLAQFSDFASSWFDGMTPEKQRLVYFQLCEHDEMQRSMGLKPTSGGAIAAN
jgi:hypothetical protein